MAHWLDNIEHNSNLFRACTTSDHNHIKSTEERDDLMSLKVSSVS